MEWEPPEGDCQGNRLGRKPFLASTIGVDKGKPPECHSGHSLPEIGKYFEKWCLGLPYERFRPGIGNNSKETVAC